MRVPVRRQPETRVSEQQQAFAKPVTPLNISPLTEVVEGFRNQLLDEQDARQRITLNRRLIEEVNGLQLDFAERQRDPEISPVDFANTTNTAYMGRHTTLVAELRQAGYSQDLIDDFDGRLATIRQGFFERGLAHQVVQLSARAGEEVEDLGVSASQYAAVDPTNNYATARDMVRSSVRTHPDLTEDQRAELEDQQLAIVRDAGARALAIQNPQLIIDTFDPQGRTAPYPTTMPSATPTTGWQGVATNVATELGLDPIEVAAVMSFETAGTFSPTIMGGTGGNYMGLIQFGPDERRTYGITNTSTPEQWTAAILGFMRDRGFRRGMSLLDFYSTINAGRPGLYNRSDSPGNTVRSHHARILREHLEPARRWMTQVAAPASDEAPAFRADPPYSGVQPWVASGAPITPASSNVRESGQAETGTPGNPVLAEVGNLYPRLRQYLGQVTIMRGQSNDDRQLEFYPPGERDNPVPGHLTVEVFNPRLQGRDLSESIGLDLLHHLGGQNPDGTPVDPEYQALKQQMILAIQRADRPLDREAYQSEQQAGRTEGTYDDWLNQSRADAYIRGIVSPRMNPEWQRTGTYTPEMQRVGDQIKTLLQHGVEEAPAVATAAPDIAGIRTGNALLDDLNGSERLQLLGHAREQQARVLATQRAEMDVRIGNITAEALNNGGEIAAPIPTEQEVLQTYGPVEGPQRWAQITQSRATGRAIVTFRTQSATTIQRSLDALEPTPGSPTYQTQLQIYQAAERAAQTLLTERQQDPAAYALRYFPSVRHAAGRGTAQYYAALDRAYQVLGIDARNAPVMTTEATQQLTRNYRDMTPLQRRQFMQQNMTEMGEARFRRFVRNMAGTTAEVDARIYALLRDYPNGAVTGNLYDQILEGREIIAQDPARRPRTEALLEVFRQVGLSSVRDLDAETSRSIQEAAEGLYAQRGGDPVHINRNLYREALRSVLGGNLPADMRRGAVPDYTILPPGVTQQQFRSWIEGLTSTSFASSSNERQGPLWGDLRTRVPVETIIDEGVFVMVSPRYYSIRMSSDGRPLMASDGNRFIMRIDSFGRTNVRSAPAAPPQQPQQDPNMRGGVM